MTSVSNLEFKSFEASTTRKRENTIGDVKLAADFENTIAKILKNESPAQSAQCRSWKDLFGATCIQFVWTCRRDHNSIPTSAVVWKVKSKAPYFGVDRPCN